MTLKQVNERLLQLVTEINELAPKVNRVEWAYMKRFNEVMLASGMSNQAAREAEAKLAMEVEGLWEPYMEIKADLRKLLTEKEVLIEYGKNVRTMAPET